MGEQDSFATGRGAVTDTRDLPEGFAPYPETSPFLDRIGPFYQKDDGQTLILAVRVLPHHCNNKGAAHGGLLAALADISLGKTCGRSREPRIPLVTTSLTIDYIGAARLGDWIEATTDFNRVGRDLAFANCFLRSGERILARANGVYKIVQPA